MARKTRNGFTNSLPLTISLNCTSMQAQEYMRLLDESYTK